jgi:thermitase
MKKNIYLAIILLFLSTMIFPIQRVSAQDLGEKRGFLVKSRNIEETKMFLNSMSVETENVIGDLGIIEIKTFTEKANEIAKNPSVIFIEENKKTKLSYSTPNDPLFFSQKYLSGSNFLNAWDITQGDDSIIVSVIDSGVNYNHEDLQGVMWTGSSGEHGYDFVSMDNDPMDEYFHGTMVAGIIGAQTNNGKGIAGGAKVKIMAVRAIGARNADDPPDMGEVSDLIEGITYSVNNGAKVINVSLGTPDGSSALDNAVKFATDRGCIIVAAVGNAYEGEAPRSTIDNPARNSSVVAVGALNEYDAKPAYSNYGPGTSVVTLGNKIYSAGWNSVSPNNSYFSGDGTSFSTPQVSAAAALLLSKDPSLSPAQIKKRIAVSAVKINGMNDYSEYYGYGKLNVYGALTYDKTPPTITASLYNSANGSYLIMADIADDFASAGNIMGNVANSNLARARYSIDSSGIWQSIFTQPSGSPMQLQQRTDVLSPGNHLITIEATDTSGNVQTKTLETSGALTAPTSNIPGDYKYQYVEQSPYISLSPGQTRSMSLTVKNIGNSAWDRTRVKLGTFRQMDRASIFSDSSWSGNNRIAMQESYVEVGGLAHFNFTVTAPSGASGTYKEYFNLVTEGITWMNDLGIYWLVTAELPSYHAQYVGQSPYLTLNPGEEANVWVDFKNTGSLVWDSGTVKLGTDRPRDEQSVFYDSASGSGWKSANRIALSQQTVDPGNIGRFSFNIKAPDQSGTYRKYFRPVAEFVTWMEDYGVYWDFVVR